MLLLLFIALWLYVRHAWTKYINKCLELVFAERIADFDFQLAETRLNDKIQDLLAKTTSVETLVQVWLAGTCLGCRRHTASPSAAYEGSCTFPFRLLPPSLLSYLLSPLRARFSAGVHLISCTVECSVLMTIMLPCP